jgi:hypothetical protein
LNVRYRVTLSQEEREQLRELVRGGHGGVRRLGPQHRLVEVQISSRGRDGLPLVEHEADRPSFELLRERPTRPP